MAINFNEIGSEHVHVKMVKPSRESRPHLDITIGSYEPISYDVEYLAELIEVLQKAQQLFGLEPKKPEQIKVPVGYSGGIMGTMPDVQKILGGAKLACEPGSITTTNDPQIGRI